MTTSRFGWRWSIRGLLLLLFGLSIPLTWLGFVYRGVQQRIVAAKVLEAAGAEIHSEFGQGISPRWEELLLGNRRSVAVVAIGASPDRANVNDMTMAVIGAFPELKELSLTGQAVSNAGFVHLQSLHRLEKLELVGCEVDDRAVETIAALPQLESLRLYGTHVTDTGIENLRLAKRLTYLDVRETLVSRSVVERLQAALTDLSASSATCNSQREVQAVIKLVRRNSARFRNQYDEIVWLESSSVHPWRSEDWAILESFPTTTCVVFDRIPIPAEAISSLAKCRQVWRIVIAAPSIAPNQLQAVTTAVNLTQLTLKLDEASDEHLVALEHCAFLSTLEVECKAISLTRPGLSAISKLRDLRSLTIHDSKFVSADLEPLSALTNLEFLDLSGCSVTDETVEILVRLPRLRELMLDNTQLTLRGVDTIKAARQIEYASWRNTGITPADYSRGQIQTPQQ